MALTYNIYRDGTKVKSGLTKKSYKDTGLTPHTEYKYQVSAQNAAGESPLSNPVTVTTEYSPATGVAVSPAIATIDVGQTKDFNATVEPNTAKQGVNWSIDKTSVATIDGNGKVTAVAAGTATITATAKTDGTVKGTASLTVNDPKPNAPQNLTVAGKSDTTVKTEWQ